MKKSVTVKSKRIENVVHKKMSTLPVQPLYDSYCVDMMINSITTFCNVLCLGYSEQHWDEANYHRWAVSKTADAHVYHEMGRMMREAYTNLSYEKVDRDKNTLVAYLRSRQA